MSKKKIGSAAAKSAYVGAAFLMATSAIGPGFLNNTAIFTQRLGASFGFVILLSMFIDIGAQYNIWRIVTGSGKPAQDLANDRLYGSGHLLAGMISFGGWVFNIGNLAGCGLGLQILTGLPATYGAAISGIIAYFILSNKQAGVQIDRFSKILGLLMIILTVYVAIASHPPMKDVMLQTLWPDKTDWQAVVVLVGGTVGGYISFAGAHRLLEAGLTGERHQQEVSRSAIRGIVLTTFMRFILFLAAFGVVAGGVSLDLGNPAASVFRSAAGSFGYYFFGIVLWSAGITSVVGATYTSVSFWQTLSVQIHKHRQFVLIVFMISSWLVLTLMGNPSRLLVIAGAVNGIILPVALAILLISFSKKQWGNSKLRLALYAIGWLVVILMTILSADTIRTAWKTFFSE